MTARPMSPISDRKVVVVMAVESTGLKERPGKKIQDVYLGTA
jgi:hypothetical protein